MSDDSQPPETNLPALELEILRAFCTLAAPSAALRSAMLSLDQHAWCEPEHRVVYDALRRLHPSRPGALREELPAVATRMGFPDVDWAPYFQPSKLTPAEFEAAVHAVLRAPVNEPLNSKDTGPPRAPLNAKDTGPARVKETRKE